MAMVSAFKRNPSNDLLELMLPRLCSDLGEDTATWSRGKALKYLSSVQSPLGLRYLIWLDERFGLGIGRDLGETILKVFG